MFAKAGNRVKIAPFLFIAPFFLVYLTFGVYPTLYGFWLSLHTGFTDYVFAGLQNFDLVLHDGKFWKSMWNGTRFAVIGSCIILPLALGVALLLNSARVSSKKGYFAAFFFSPNVASAVAVALTFGLIFNQDFGVLNALLQLVGLKSVAWLSDPRWTMFSLILLSTWRYLGINILYFLAGLQNVPKDLIEAATVDGANVFKRFIHVTLPLLKPVTMFIVFTSVLGGYNMFSEAYILGGRGGGPGNSLLFPTIYLYEQAFRSQNFTYASAIGYSFTLLLLVFSVLQFQLFRSKD